jgi:hypothetical protein
VFEARDMLEEVIKDIGEKIEWNPWQITKCVIQYLHNTKGDIIYVIFRVAWERNI